MPDVRPFPGLRYDPNVAGGWGAQLGPPYDVINAGQAASLRERGPYQITHVESAASAAEMAEARRLLADWRRDGILIADHEPAFYLDEHRFRLHGEQRMRFALFAAVRLTPWEDKQVLPHEWTIAGPKEERRRLRRAVRADISPVMMLAPDRAGTVRGLLADALALPVVVEGADPSGDQHRLRLLRDPGMIGALHDAFTADPLYIADGHHRYESALQVRDELAKAAGDAWSGEEDANFLLAGIVCAEDPGLALGATHRIVLRTAPEDVMARLGERFTIEDVGPDGDGPRLLLDALAAEQGEANVIGAAGLQPGRLLLLRANARTADRIPSSVPPSWRTMDVAILHYVALEPIFGIGEAALRAGDAVTYTHDTDEAFAATRQGRVAFYLNPPSLESIVRSADAGDRMPQKSTFFVPKLPTGVVLHTFAE